MPKHMVIGDLLNLSLKVDDFYTLQGLFACCNHSERKWVRKNMFFYSFIYLRGIIFKDCFCIVGNYKSWAYFRHNLRSQFYRSTTERMMKIAFSADVRLLHCIVQWFQSVLLSNIFLNMTDMFRQENQIKFPSCWPPKKSDSCIEYIFTCIQAYYM